MDCEPQSRRRNGDLGLVADTSGRLQSCTVIVSSQGMRGRHSTSNILTTLDPVGPGIYHDAPGLRSNYF